MSEMIGILVIVGLISIAGAEGYKLAMEGIQSNKILNEAMAQSAELSSKRRHKIVNGKIIYFGKSDFIISRTYDSENNIILLTTKTVPENVCKNLANEGKNKFFSKITSSSTFALTFTVPLSYDVYTDSDGNKK